MAEKIVSLAEINDALARSAGKNAKSKLRKAFDETAREDAIYAAMGESDEQRFFTTKEHPGKNLLSQMFGREAVYCTAAAFTNVVALSGLSPAAKEAALKAATAAPDHSADREEFAPYPRYVGFSG